MNNETVMWSHNPEQGIVIGTLITAPKQMQFIMELRNELVVSALVIDSCKRKWRVRANAHLAGQLLTYQVGQKIQLIGIKGSLCKGAWDGAKRQVVPINIELKKGK